MLYYMHILMHAWMDQSIVQIESLNRLLESVYINVKNIYIINMYIFDFLIDIYFPKSILSKYQI